MQPPNNYKPGLHKQVSSIFTGVPIPDSSAGGPKPPVVSPSKPPAVSSSNPAIPTGPATPKTAAPTNPPAPTLPAAPKPGATANPPAAKPTAPTQTMSARTALLDSLAPQVANPCQFKQQLHKPTPPAVVKPVTSAKTTRKSLVQKIKDKLSASGSAEASGKQKLMVVMVPVLAVVLVLIFVKTLSSPSRSLARTRNAQQATAGSPDFTGGTEVKWDVPAPYSKTLRDPMKVGAFLADKVQTVIDAAKEHAEKIKDLEVKGILYSRDNPAAIVGTQIVHQGDVVSGAKVLKITKNTVEFELDGKKWEQNIQP